MSSDTRAALDELRALADNAEGVWHSKVPLPVLREYHTGFRPEVVLWLLDLLDVSLDSANISRTIAEHRGATELMSRVDESLSARDSDDLMTVAEFRFVLKNALSEATKC